MVSPTWAPSVRHIGRDAVDLCTSSSRATSVTPPSPPGTGSPGWSPPGPPTEPDRRPPARPRYHRAAELSIAQHYRPVGGSAPPRYAQATDPGPKRDRHRTVSFHWLRSVLFSLDRGQAHEASLLHIMGLVVLYATQDGSTGGSSCGCTCPYRTEGPAGPGFPSSRLLRGAEAFHMSLAAARWPARVRILIMVSRPGCPASRHTDQESPTTKVST